MTKFARITRFLAQLTLALIIVPTQLASAEANEPLVISAETQKALTIVTRQMGRILPERELPDLYAAVRLIFNRTVKPQEDLIEKQYVPVNYFFIIDSPFENAFVTSEKKPGVRVSKNLVFITTATLRRLINLNDDYLKVKYRALSKDAAIDQEIVGGAHRVAGVSVHENAHPIDKLVVNHGMGEGDILSIGNEYGDRRASQAIELQADTLGMEFLRQANLPEESLIDALEVTLDLDMTPKMADAVASTHPENSMRLTFARMVLTLKHRKFGANHNVKPFTIADFNRAGLIRDLERIRKSVGAMAWYWPQTLGDALERLKRLGHIQETLTRYLEYNRLWLALNEHIRRIEAANGRLSKDEERQIVEAATFLNENGHFGQFWDSEERSDKIGKLSDSQDLFRLPLHSRSLQTLKFYSSPAWIACVAAMGGKTLQTLESYLPAKVIVDRYLLNTIQWVEDNALQKTDADNSAHLENRELFSEFVTLAQNKFGREIGTEKALAIFLSFAQSGGPNFPFFFYSRNIAHPLYKAHSHAVQLLRQTRTMAGQNHPQASRAWAMMVDYAQHFWNNRGYFAVLELIARGRPSRTKAPEEIEIDWNFIGEILGLDRRQMDNQVSKSVTEMLANQDFYKNLNQYLASSKYAALAYMGNPTNIGPFAEKAEQTPSWLRGSHVNTVLNLVSGPAPEPTVHYGQVARADSQHLLKRALLAIRPDLLHKFYQEHVGEFLSEPRSEPIDQNSVHTTLLDLEKSFTRKYGIRAEEYRDENHISSANLAQGISKAPGLDENQKQILLRFAFLRDGRFTEEQSAAINPKFQLWMTLKDEDVEVIGKTLLQHNVAKDYTDLIFQLRKSPHYEPFQKIAQYVGERHEQIKDLNSYYEMIDRFAPLLVQELKSRGRLTAQDLRAYGEILNTPYRLQVDRTKSNTPNIRDLRDAIAEKSEAIAPNQSASEIMDFFLLMTATGATDSTDNYFKKYIMTLPGFATGRYDRWIKGVLITGRIESQTFKLELTQTALKLRINELKRRIPIRTDRLDSLITDINMMVPQGSLARDKFLEQIAWDLQLADAQLFGFIEDQKTTNWRRENPNMVNMGSLLSAAIFNLSKSRRKLLIRYLMDPKSYRNGVPDEVFREIKQNATNQFMEAFTGRRGPLERAQSERQAERFIRELKIRINSYVRDSAPTERIPLLELILTAGHTAILKAGNAVWIDIGREFLGYEENSNKEKLYLSYLSILPPNHVAPSLAYLLSQAGNDKATVANIFSVFGTVGIKFAQLSSIFELFGKDVARETKHLKDNAPPMTSYEIRRQMAENGISEQLIRDLTLEEILGSASIKTIVRVKPKGGPRVAMGVQAGEINNQIKTNLELGRLLLDELERRNMVKHSRMLATLIEALREQLDEEIDFELEAERLKIAAQNFQDYNRVERANLKGWSFEVPSLAEGMPSGKKIIFYTGAWGKKSSGEDDLGSAVTFDKLTEAQKQEVGELLVRSSLAMLFRYGEFDADRHKGNWLIDVNRKKIYALDFGQLTSFSRSKSRFLYDPRLVIVEFLKALKDKDPSKLYQAMVNMRKADTTAPPLTSELKNQINEAMNQKSYSDVLVDLLTATTEAGFTFDKRYSFGAMKGLITLYGEKYLAKSNDETRAAEENHERFIQIISEEAEKLARNKLPALLIKKLTGKTLSCASQLGSKKRKAWTSKQ